MEKTKKGVDKLKEVMYTNIRRRGERQKNC
jgi:hypothetical protein